MDSIEVSKKRSFEISANKLIEEAAKEHNKDSSIKEYTIIDGVFTDNNLDVKGDLPPNGNIRVSKDGEVAISIYNDKWCSIKQYNEDKEMLLLELMHLYIMVVTV